MKYSKIIMGLGTISTIAIPIMQVSCSPKDIRKLFDGKKDPKMEKLFQKYLDNKSYYDNKIYSTEEEQVKTELLSIQNWTYLLNYKNYISS